MSRWGWTPEQYVVPSERKIIAINNNTLTLNAPMVQTIEDQYGGGKVYRFTNSGRLNNIGVENLRLESEFDFSSDESHAWIGIEFQGVVNSWVRKVTAQFFGYACVSVEGSASHSPSKYVTIEDCAMLDPKSITGGGRKYSFNIASEGGEFILFQRCYTRGGRHDYVTGGRISGPNVFLDCISTSTRSSIGPHHRYATGTLFDNIQGGEMEVRNRQNSGTGHGWAGAQTMYWNCNSTRNCDNNSSTIWASSPPTAQNWVVGTKFGAQKGSTTFESSGTHVRPRSLYLAQLKERLGQGAVNNITTPAQRAGNIWNILKAWAGEPDSSTPANTYRRINGDYFIESASNGQRSLSSTNDFNIRMGSASGANSRQWTFKHIENDLHTIRNIETRRYMQTSNVTGTRCANNVNINTSPSANSSHQKWRILEVGNNIYLQPSNCTSRVFDKSTGNNGNAKILQFQATNNNQQLKLVKVSGGAGNSTPSPTNCDFVKMPGRAIDIGSGGGKTFVIGLDNLVYEWKNNRWVKLASSPLATRIDVDGRGRPWIIGTNGVLYQWIGNRFSSKRNRFKAIDIGVSKEKYFVIDEEGVLHRYDGNGKYSARPFRVPGIRLDVSPSGSVWMVGNDGHVYQNKVSRWISSRKGNFKAKDLSIRDDKFILWALSEQGVSFNYLGGGRWNNQGGVADHISAARDGSYWVVNSNQRSSESEENFIVRSKEGKQSELYWIINQIAEPVSYTIYHGNDLDNFVELETISAENDLSYISYKFTHEFPNTGDNHYFIEVEYANGVIDYIPYKTVTFQDTDLPISVFPNPSKGNLYLDLSDYMDVEIQYSIVNLFGEVLQEGSLNKNHTPRVTLNLQNYQNGSYIIHIKPENSRAISQKIMLIRDY